MWCDECRYCAGEMVYGVSRRNVDGTEGWGCGAKEYAVGNMVYEGGV